MGAGTTYCAAVTGTAGELVRVDAVTRPGPSRLMLAGLAETAVRPLHDRVRAAIINSHLPWPGDQVTVTLDPGVPPHRGGAFDLAIAVAIVAAAGSVPGARLQGTALVGELGLDGRLRPVPGVLPAVTAVAAAGLATVIVPPVSEAEARLVPGIRVLAAPGLAEVVRLLAGRRDLNTSPRDPGHAAPAGPGVPEPDTVLDPPCPVWGQQAAEISAAGGHGLLLLGQPGPAAAEVAAAVAHLMPDLSPDESAEVTAVHSVAGFLDPVCPLVTRPPLITPGSAVTVAAMLGGGSPVIRPGLASLAHRGVLYLEGGPEYGRQVLDGLRQPLVQGRVVIERFAMVARFPARFTLVTSAALCPCGQAVCAGTGGPGCGCTRLARRRYLARLGGPLLDHLDVRIIQPASPGAGQAAGLPPHGPDSSPRARADAARARAARRLAGTPWRANADVPGSELRRRFPPAPGALLELDRAVALGRVSSRAAGQVLGVAWTLADLGGLDEPDPEQVAAALELRLGTAL